MKVFVKKEVAWHPVIAFGQNITRGSCLGGFTRGIEPKKGGMTINSTNSENTLVGAGFGLMLEGASAIFFMKQLDFLLLGIDQLINTYNNILSTSIPKALGSFTIMPLIVDNGYQGPQSSFNNFADVCTIAKIRGYTVTNKHDARRILSKHMVSRGFRIIAVSQRLFGTELVALPRPLHVGKDDTVFQYSAGSDVTIVSCNFALPEAYRLTQECKKRGMSVAFFNINSPVQFDARRIIESANKTKRLVVLDDSKSDNLPANSLLASPDLQPLSARILLKRNLGKDWLYPVSDSFIVDYKSVVDAIRAS